MKYPSLKFLESLNVAILSSEELAYYAYALMCCRYPASVIFGEWHQKVNDVCSRKIAELKDEINRRFEIEGKSDTLAHALSVIEEKADLVEDGRKRTNPQDLTKFSDTELVELYSMSKCRYDMRHAKVMELFTRSYQ